MVRPRCSKPATSSRGGLSVLQPPYRARLVAAAVVAVLRAVRQYKIIPFRRAFALRPVAFLTNSM